MIWNTDLVETLELQNLLTNAMVFVHLTMINDSKRHTLQPRGRNLVELMLVKIILNEMIRNG
jgi:hypothetical protein